MSFLDMPYGCRPMTPKEIKEYENKKQKLKLSCDLLSGYGGLSVADAFRIASWGNLNEAQEFADKLWSESNEYLRQKREKHRDKLKNPQSIYLRKTCRKNPKKIDISK